MGDKLTYVDDLFEKKLSGSRIHLVGAKGTGMAAIAEILSSWGVILTGADVAETFQTQDILDRIGLKTSVGFSACDLPSEVDLIIYSAAYVPETNPQLIEGKKRGVPIMSYPTALGKLSLSSESIAIAGVHGKSTTAAMCSILINELDLPATVLSGTGIINFDNSSVIIRGSKFFVAETCEYRNHFNQFKADHVVITNVELEHVDSFRTRRDIVNAFVKFVCGLSKQGKVIYCADDLGAVEVASRVSDLRSDIKLIPYGETASGKLNISNVQVGEGQTSFQMKTFNNQLYLSVPGRHNVLNATAAIGIITEIMLGGVSNQVESRFPVINKSLKQFKGGKRRTELVGEVGGVIFIDDYAHHPTAISSTLEGIVAYYPGRRIVVDFMSHTFSRTKAFKEDFGVAFLLADELLLHPVYGSAREFNQVIDSSDDTAESIGRMLFEYVKKKHTKVSYHSSLFEAANYLSRTLSSGDILMTMGAGDNWRVGIETMKLIKAVSQHD